MISNVYSAAWFDLFLQNVPEEQTEREVVFVDSLLPEQSRILDIPCGAGRHAKGLATRGHKVVGVDRDPSVLSKADYGEGIAFVAADMGSLPLRPGSVDAVICLWQSFGFLDPSGNAAVLSEWALATRPGGHLILDLYNRSFFEAHSGERSFDRGSSRVHEKRTVSSGRLVVEITYSNGGSDRFDWQLFSPEELQELALQSGWILESVSTGFDIRNAPNRDSARAQYAFRRTAL